jgi:cytochrome b561
MPRRYHPVLVALHWIVALSVIALLIAGTVLLAPLANEDPAKMLSFRLHMGLGLLTFFLMTLRLAVRMTTRVPSAAVTGNPALDRVARANHWGLYLFTFLMAGSGVAFARASGLPDAVFGQGPMPPDFSAHAARQVHGVASAALMALLALHVGAALWHQFWRRDRLFARIWFGPR